MRRRIIDLDYVFVRVLRLFDGERARLWLIGSEPLLGGARPLDVLTLRGPAPLIRALDGIEAGVFA